MSFNFMAEVTILILDARKIKSVTGSPSICHEVMGLEIAREREKRKKRERERELYLKKS